MVIRFTLLWVDVPRHLTERQVVSTLPLFLARRRLFEEPWRRLERFLKISVLSKVTARVRYTTYTPSHHIHTYIIHIGTPVGDSVELTALRNVFRDCKNQSVAVGSVKSNIGHLKSAAGFAGMLKAVLSLKHKVIPATINVKNPCILRDKTTLQDSALYLNTKMRPWFTKNGKKRVAGVSSFGFGGANYHCVLEEYVTSLHLWFVCVFLSYTHTHTHTHTQVRA